MTARPTKRFARFTDRQLRYIYLHCDFDVNIQLFKSIERKIRKGTR